MTFFQVSGGWSCICGQVVESCCLLPHCALVCCMIVLVAEPINVLSGHTANVCSLAAGKSGTLVSGSWDW